MKTKYLKKKNYKILSDKHASASTPWKQISEHRYHPENGLLWNIDNKHSINFWHDN